MSTKRFRLTKAAKIMVFMLIIALLGGGVFVGLKTGIIKTNKNPKCESVVASNTSKNNDKVETDDIVNNTKESEDEAVDSDEAINISLDEWIG